MDANEERQLLSADRRSGPRLVTPAIAISLVLLVASAAAAISFVAATGGLRLAGSVPSPVAIASGAPSPTPSGATETPTSTPTAEPTPSPTPSLTPAPTPTLEPTATPGPTSDRYALLTPCPDKPDCYLYTIRAGDNLQSIANYFGVPYTTVRQLNPNLRIPIHRGDIVVLPPPTR